MGVYNLDKVPTLEVLAFQHLRWLHSHGRKGGTTQGVPPSGNLSCSPGFSLLPIEDGWEEPFHKGRPSKPGIFHCTNCPWQMETQILSPWKFSFLCLLPWVLSSSLPPHFPFIICGLMLNLFQRKEPKAKFQQVQQVHYKYGLRIPLEREQEQRFLKTQISDSLYGSQDRDHISPKALPITLCKYHSQQNRITW